MRVALPVLFGCLVPTLGFTPQTLGLSASAQPRAQTAALRIVVIEGEGAVNIIQQKTAVAPVVEIRDRNDQPVAGAVVQFAIRNGRATFNGARTISVTTNAAGRAVAAGLTPTGSGTLQIGASAAFQGQTAAATIVQSNVMTAAQAAAASSAGAGAGGGSSGAAAGTGAGAGGGLSATTIAIIGGAAAGGALVAKEALGGPTTIFEGDIAGDTIDTFARATPCTNTVRWTAHLVLTLKIEGSEVSGGADVKGATNLVTSSTCPANNVGSSNPWGFSGDRVEGTINAIRFRGTDTGTGYSNTYDFLGALNGDTLTGALTITTNTTVGNVTGSGVIPVTLQKTQ